MDKATLNNSSLSNDSVCDRHYPSETTDNKKIENTNENYIFYCVSSGDTIERVAAKFRMTPNKLLSLNKLLSRTLIVNQKLKVNIPDESESNKLADMINGGNEKLPTNVNFHVNEHDSSADIMLLPLHYKENYIKVISKYITDSEGVIKGKLLLTPAFFTFIPAFSDPVVIEYGDEKFAIHLPNNKIACVSMYNNSEMMTYKRSQRIDMTSKMLSPADQNEWLSLKSDLLSENPSNPCRHSSLFSDSGVIENSISDLSKSYSLDDFLNRSVYVQDIENLKSLKFFDHKYLCVVASPRYRKTKAIYQKDDEYWFIVPKNSVQMLMDYFLTHAQTKYDVGADVDSKDNWESEGTNVHYNTGQLIKRNSFAKVEDTDGHINKMKNKLEKTFKKLKSKSIQWEIVNTDIDFNLNSYDESEEVDSKILDLSQVKELLRHLPSETISATWELIYTTDRDGWSLATLYRNVYNSTRGCCLLLIKDSNSKIFGAMCNSYIRMSTAFYGNGTTFIFRWNPNFEKFSYSHKNNYFLYGQPEFFSIGCSNCKNAIRIDKDLYSGVTEACDTFNSPPLVTTKEFEIKNLEIWSFY